MSYYLEDAGGKYLGDLASNLGLRDLREQGDKPALSEFIRNGQVSATDIPALVDELDSDPETEYVAQMLRDVSLSVIITDGLGTGEEDATE